MSGEDSDGWCFIDKIGGWNSYLCQFQVIEEVPAQHRETWTWAFSTILERIDSASSSTELDRGLMWLMFLPQALLRQTKRGGKSGRKMVAQRFNALVNHDWGKLVQLWEADMKWNSEVRSNQKHKDTKNDIKDLKDSKTKAAVRLISKGQISKAVNRMNSHGLASMDDPRVMQQVSSKYPDRGRQLPDFVTGGKPVENLSGLREALLELEMGKSPGTGGMRPEYLKVLAEEMTNEQFHLLESFGMKYLCGNLPPWFYEVWLTVMTVPLFKVKKMMQYAHLE